MSRLGKIFYLFSAISFVSLVVIRLLIGGWIPFLWVCLGLFVGFLGGGIWQDRDFFREFFGMKTTKQGLSMGTLVVLVMTSLIAVNFIAVRKYKVFDFSAAQTNTLSAQSIQLLKALNADLKVLYFYQKGADGVEENRRAFIELLKKYQDQSSFVKLEFVDVNERPDLAEKYGVNKGNGVVFLDYKDHNNQIQKIDEQELTSALVKVTREKDKIVYFTVGHGEKSIDEARDTSGLNAFKGLLEGNRYVVKTLALTQMPEVPVDADAVLIVGPTQGFLASEIKSLENFLKRGGSLVMALEPKAQHHLQPLLAEIGLEIKDDYLVNFMDTQIGRAVNPQATVGAQFSPTHQITKPFEKNLFTVFRLPQSVVKMDKSPPGLTYEPLVKTTDKTMSYKETTFKTPGPIGVYNIAMAVQGRLPGSDEKTQAFNVVVFGDADFLSNQLLYQNLNRDLALNSLAFLAKEENLISITPKEIGITTMQMSEASFYLFIFGFIVMVPLALLIISGTLWLRRRHA
jgi:ABC-type uncharacterized transport system involved in gliding motility auxiliary subunit